MRWQGLLCGTILMGAATPALSDTVNLHQIYTAGDCVPGQTQTIEVPRGRLTLNLHIKNWSPAAYAGIPYWTAFNRYEPEVNNWTGWGQSLTGTADSSRARTISSKRSPDSPVSGGILDYTETDEILMPFRLQVQISGPTWHSGDGMCHQGAMETWLTVTTSAAAPSSGNWAGTWSGNMTLTQNGSNVTGTSSEGDIVGTANGPDFNGYWIATSSRYKCTTQRNGSWYWGRIHWTLTTDGQHFVGTSGYCEADPAGGTNWNGDRVGGAPASTQTSSPTGAQTVRNVPPPPPPPPPVVTGKHEITQLSENWNPGACGFTDTARLELNPAAHIGHVDLWYNWSAGENDVPFTLTRNGQPVMSGTLKRAECDPYQSAWCVARGRVATDLAAGRYAFHVGNPRVCQNAGSGGNGFIKAFGYRPPAGAVR